MLGSYAESLLLTNRFFITFNIERSMFHQMNYHCFNVKVYSRRGT